MNKIIKFTVFSLVVCALMPACYDDNGNYDYIDPEQVSSLKLEWEEEEIFNTIGIPLTLKPKVTGLDDPSNYEFNWIWTTSGAKVDTIGKGQNLEEVPLYYDPGRYKLNYHITDKRNGYTFINHIFVNISSEFSRGWIVSKSIDGMTDLDFIRYDGVVSNNLILGSQGTHLEGNPRLLAYQRGYYAHSYTNEEGLIVNLANQKVFHVATDKDAATFNSSTLALYKRWNEWFWSTPEIYNPRYIFIPDSPMVTAIINDGTVSAIYAMADSRGKYAGRPYNGNFDYQVADFMYGYNSFFYVFERTTRTFLTMYYYSSFIYQFDATGKHNNMDCDLVKWMIKTTPDIGMPTSYVVMKTDSGQYRIYQCNVMMSSGDNFLSAPNDLSSTSGLVSAPYYAAHPSTETIYFSGGNHQLYRLTVPNGDERVIYSFPAGENITAIRANSFYTEEGNSRGLAVATETSTGWKLYVFQYVGDTPELQAKPLYEFSGTGTIRNMEYVLN